MSSLVGRSPVFATQRARADAAVRTGVRLQGSESYHIARGQVTGRDLNSVWAQVAVATRVHHTQVEHAAELHLANNEADGKYGDGIESIRAGV